MKKDEMMLPQRKYSVWICDGDLIAKYSTATDRFDAIEREAEHSIIKKK